MQHYQPLSIIGFHSCDRAVGLKVLNGKDELIPSNNSWDWLGGGVYFWEQNPYRSTEYANESANNIQFNKKPIKDPFVIGAIIDLGNCFNLVESESLKILSSSYKGLHQAINEAGKQMPVNKGKNRALDCAVIEYVHKMNVLLGLEEYDTVRCAFSEGDEVYPGSAITSRLHIQICVRNLSCIKGFFLPRPLEMFNPGYK